MSQEFIVVKPGVDLLSADLKNAPGSIIPASEAVPNGKSAAQLECDEFNKTVNTRQVRRHYARVMAKRGGNE